MSRRRKSKRKKTSSPVQFAFGIAPVYAAAAAGLWTAWTLYAFARLGMKFDAQIWGQIAGFLPVSVRLLLTNALFDLAHAAGMWYLFDRLGRVVLLRLGIDERGERLLCCALGAGAASLALLLLGLAGWWRVSALRVLFYGGVCGGLAADAYQRFGRAREPREPAAPQRQAEWGPWELGAAALIAGVALLNLVVTLVPEIFYDSLVYHLALPQLYLHRGGIVATPENVYSGIPFGLQMLFGWALALSSENLAALVHAACGLGTVWALWTWARRYAATSTGVFAALLFYLCPIAIYSSWHCGVDLGASFYITAALYALSRSIEEDEERRGAWAVAAGALAGFAMSTKYNVFPLGLALIAVRYALGRRLERGARDSLWMGAAAAAVLAPWLIKNAVFYGNPLYPFMHGAVGWARPIDWQNFMEAAGSRRLPVTFGSWGGFWDAVSAPWKASFGDRPAGDWPGPAFIIFVPWALLLPWSFWRADGKEGGARTAVLALAASGIMVAVFASRLVRYALPALPLLALVAALAVDRKRLPNWLRRAGWAAALFAGIFNVTVTYRQGALIDQWRYLYADWNKADFLKQQRTTYGLPYYGAMEYLGARTPPEAKVLFLGESRAFYCPRDFIAATLYDENPFWKAAREAANAADLHRRVRAMGITHIFMSARQLLYRRASAAVYPRDVVRGKVFGAFWKRYLAREFEDREDFGENPRWLTVYRVLDEPNSDAQTFPENPARVMLEFLEKNELPDGTLKEK
ncbi:MAG: glycosyltransferase family 39 protein [Elusimicrobiota bacterium]